MGFPILAMCPASKGRERVHPDHKGCLSPASADYLVRGINKATEAQARLAVIEMDTPGGLKVSFNKFLAIDPH